MVWRSQVTGGDWRSKKNPCALHFQTTLPSLEAPQLILRGYLEPSGKPTYKWASYNLLYL